MPACFLVLLQSQLAALVSKCKGPEDLDYFLLEAAALVGLNTTPEAGPKVRHAFHSTRLRCSDFMGNEQQKLLDSRVFAVVSLR